MFTDNPQVKTVTKAESESATWQHGFLIKRLLNAVCLLGGLRLKT